MSERRIAPGTRLNQIWPSTGKTIRQVEVVAATTKGYEVRALNGPLRGCVYEIAPDHLGATEGR